MNIRSSSSVIQLLLLWCNFFHERSCAFCFLPLVKASASCSSTNPQKSRIGLSGLSLASSEDTTTTTSTTTTTTTDDTTTDDMASTTAAAAARRLVGKLKPETSALMVCDIQTKFRPLVWKGETVVRTAQMTSVAKALKIPIVVTQQYTKVFGPTVPEVFSAPTEDLATYPIFEKKKFSMMTPEVQSHVDSNLSQVTSFVLVGIEAHVCLQQTALDLLEQGKDVHVIVDGVSSQQPLDREIALQRMSQAGAYLTTAQSAAFMLMQSAEHENFKTVSKLTVEHMKLENEFNELAMKK